MKKYIKISIIIAIALFQCLLLSGCNALDDMREHQIYYDDNGNIVIQGELYKALPYCEQLQPPTTYDFASTYNVTKEDVPVLLSNIYSMDSLNLSNDGNFLISNYYNTIYCHEDLYDSIADKIEKGFTYSGLGYYYYYNSDENGFLQEEYYRLTKEQIDAVDNVLSSVETTSLSDGFSFDYQWIVSIEKNSEDLLFREYLVDIAVFDNTYYIIEYTDIGGTLYYPVPDEYAHIFEDIMAAYVEAESVYLSDY